MKLLRGVNSYCQKEVNIYNLSETPSIFFLITPGPWIKLKNPIKDLFEFTTNNKN